MVENLCKYIAGIHSYEDYFNEVENVVKFYVATHLVQSQNNNVSMLCTLKKNTFVMA